MERQEQVSFADVPSLSTKSNHYDSRLVQQAQSRQQASLNGGGRRSYVYGQQFHNSGEESAQDSPSSSQNQSNMYNGEDDIIDLGLTNTSDFDWDRTKQEAITPPPQSMERSHVNISADRPTGLRHFSTKVCEKVKQKGLTNYNEVADELVAEYFENNVIHHVDVVKQEYDMKNIRRRVYDALNVLLAMNIITKNKKDIRWIGLPASSAQEIARLEEDKKRREDSIKTKLEALQENIVQLVTYKNLISRNKESEDINGRPDPQSLLYLPFLMINTSSESMVECSVSGDKSEYLFSFDKPFEIHDDLEILKKMGLACGLDDGSANSKQVELAKSYLPPLIRPYIDVILEGHKRLLEEKEIEGKRQESLRIEEADQRQHMFNNGTQNNRAFVEEEHLESDEEDINEPLVREPIKTANANVPIRQVIQGNRMNHHHPNIVGQNRIIRHAPIAQSSGHSNNGGPSVVRPRYFVQKAAPNPTIHRSVHTSQIGSRPYVNNTTLPLDRRSAGQPMKYFVAASQQGQQTQAFKYVTVPQKVQVRPTPPGTARVVYAPSNRIIQQRVVHSGGPHPPGTIVRKVIKRVIVPPAKSNISMQNVQLIRKVEDVKTNKQVDMPMSSRQSDMLQQQQQQHQQTHQQQHHQHQPQHSQFDPQFDNFYDSMDMSDNQIMNDVSNEINFQ